VLGRHHDVPKRELTPAELDARRIQDEQDAAMLITAAFAGLRVGELRALRWNDIDFELHVIHYVHHIPQHDAADRLSARLAKTSGAAATLGRAAAQVG
jgi:integrase